MKIMHVDYAIPVSVYFKEGRVGVLETKRTRQHTSLPYLLTTQSHPPCKDTGSHGGSWGPHYSWLPGLGCLSREWATWRSWRVWPAWDSCRFCTCMWTQESRRGFLENLRLSLLPGVFGMSGHFSFPISKPYARFHTQEPHVPGLCLERRRGTGPLLCPWCCPEAP